MAYQKIEHRSFLQNPRLTPGAIHIQLTYGFFVLKVNSGSFVAHHGFLLPTIPLPILIGILDNYFFLTPQQSFFILIFESSAGSLQFRYHPQPTAFRAKILARQKFGAKAVVYT